jgi:hypothetical protein
VPAIGSFPLDGVADDGDEGGPAKTEDADAIAKAHSSTVTAVFVWKVIFTVADPLGREERETGKPAQPTIDSHSLQN